MILLITIATLVAVLKVEFVSSGSISNRIIRGESTTIKDRPFQVSIQKSTQTPPFGCGGSIISEKYVLTAAHCLLAGREFLTIRAGSTYHDRDGSIHHIESFIVHDDFDLDSSYVVTNDIALLKVKEPFQFDETKQPIKLFESGELAKPGTEAVISGWGETEFGTIPEELMKVTLPIVSNKECKKAYRNDGGIPTGQICAGYLGVGGKETCKGDSGGPLTINNRLAGVVSWAIGCAQSKYPGVYTEIAYYRDWIKKNADV